MEDLRVKCQTICDLFYPSLHIPMYLYEKEHLLLPAMTYLNFFYQLLLIFYTLNTPILLHPDST